MATAVVATAVTATLTANTEDVILFSGLPDPDGVVRRRIRFVNCDATATNIIYVRWDGTAAVIAAAGTIAIPANSIYQPPANIGRLSIICVGTPVYNVSTIQG